MGLSPCMTRMTLKRQREEEEDQDNNKRTKTQEKESTKNEVEKVNNLENRRNK